MRLSPSVQLSKPVAILVVAFALLLSPLLLFFGTVELLHPDVGAESLTQNTIVCLVLILLGLSLLAYAVGVVRSSLLNRGGKSSESSESGA